MAQAAPVPRERLAVDEHDAGPGHERLDLGEVLGRERIGLRREQDGVGRERPHLVVREGRVPVAVGGHVLEAAPPHHVRDDGVAADGHPRVPPDEVERPHRAGRRGEGGEPGRDLVRDPVGRPAPPDGRADGADHGDGAGDVGHVGDVDRAERGDGLDLLADVLLLVRDDEVRRQPADAPDVDGLGPPDDRLGRLPPGGADAEPREPDDLGVQAEVGQQLRLRRDERDDAPGRGGEFDRAAEGVDGRGGAVGHGVRRRPARGRAGRSATGPRAPRAPRSGPPRGRRTTRST